MDYTYIYDFENGFYRTGKTIEELVKRAEKNTMELNARFARILALRNCERTKDNKPIFRVKRLGRKNGIVMLNPGEYYVGIDFTPIYSNELPHINFQMVGIHCEINNLAYFPYIFVPSKDEIVKGKKKVTIHLSQSYWEKENKETANFKEIDNANIVDFKFVIPYYSPVASSFGIGEQTWRVRKGRSFSTCRVKKKDGKKVVFYGDLNCDIAFFIERLVEGEETL